MIPFGQARNYVADYLLDDEKSRFLDTFFDHFETGGYTVLDDRGQHSSSEFFRRSRDMLSHIFVYRLANPKDGGMKLAFTCFDETDPAIIDYSVFINHAMAYFREHLDRDESDDFDPAPIVERKLPIDGAFLIGGQEDDELNSLRHWHITRAYLTPEHSRQLLFGAVSAALEDGFQ